MSTNPIIRLITSEQFITTVIGLIVALIVAAIPALEPYQGQIITVITVLVLGLIGSITFTNVQALRTEQAHADTQTARLRLEAAVAQNSGRLEAMSTPPSSYGASVQNARQETILVLDELLNSGEGEQVPDIALLQKRIREMGTNQLRYRN